MFNKGVHPARRTAIAIALDIREVLSHDKYLGLPTVVGRSRKKPFLFIVDRLKRRLSCWMGRLASWAGREVLIKAVAQAIPTYSMSVFKLSVDLCHTIQASINRFWWGHKQDGRKIHWLGASKLSLSKEDGGLGFRDMEAFNNALLAKRFWRLLQNKSPLLLNLLRAKYFPHGDILHASLGQAEFHLAQHHGR